MIDLAYAMGAPAGGGGQGGMGQIMSFLPIVLIFVVFYFLLIRPQQKKAKDHRVLLDNIKVGDSILTNGGIYGKVTGLRENVLTVEISDKVRVKVSRGHVAGVVKPDVMKTE